MVYKYEEERERVFTEAGVKTLRGIEARVDELLELAGAFRLWEGVTGLVVDSFVGLACIDYLVEVKKIHEIPTNGPTQDRVFVRGSWFEKKQRSRRWNNEYA